MKNISLLILLSSLLFSCSGRRTVDDVSTNSEVIELSTGEDELLEFGDEVEERVGAIEINDDSSIMLDDGSSNSISIDNSNTIVESSTVNVGGVQNPGYEVTPQYQGTQQYETVYQESSHQDTRVANNSNIMDPAEARRLAQGRTVKNYGNSSVTYSEPSVTYNTNTYQAPRVSNNGGSLREYTVTENETLMMVAFKLYGNYTMWRDLARLNKDRISNPHNLSKGTRIVYEDPANGFSWNPRGEPYLIKTGDTLYKISDKVYNNGSKWQYIWNNNRPLIKDPNLIFAGFTIYYLLNDGRDVASL